MLQRIKFLLQGNESFAIETTLSTKSYANLVKEAKLNGFQVQLLFFWLLTPDHAIERVAQRVKEGGHNTPVDVIRRRYQAGIETLFNIYIPIVDSWMLIENQSNPRIIIAIGKQHDTRISNNELFEKIKAYVK